MATQSAHQQTQAAASRRIDPSSKAELEELTRLVRYHILLATTSAGSGHPSSSLSATELMTALLFGGTFRFDVDNPGAPNNDRLLFSKGHASPLFYALWLAAGQVTDEEMMSYRQFGSDLEGHPTPSFRFAEAATGSLGQGLSIALGFALNGKLVDNLPYRSYVLLGDSEMTEGSQWEAIELAAHYKLDNLVGVLDVNRLGQRGATIHGHDCSAYARRISAFGWNTICVDGHDLDQIVAAYQQAQECQGRPTMIIAQTVKGKGVSLLEDQHGWHGKALSEEQMKHALAELGKVRKETRGRIPIPEQLDKASRPTRSASPPHYELGEKVATRTAYGAALSRIADEFPGVLALDAEVSNSTMVESFAKRNQGRFFEMYIAEQNMVGAALGLARRGKIPFVSTFAAFMTRAFDQIRMAAYSQGNIKFVGSHAGVAIGEDGASQMGLEDVAMFRSILGSVVLQPADAVSTEKLVEVAARHEGIVYLRTMRQKTPVLYENTQQFAVGGCQILRQSEDDVCCVVASGATVHEALSAYEDLRRDGISIRLIDAYSIKPLDVETILRAAVETGRVITVEDHYPEGGLGEAVLAGLSATGVPVALLAVRVRPRSGQPAELLEHAEISANSITNQVRESIRPRSTMA